jgi:hypothetical protein
MPTIVVFDYAALQAYPTEKRPVLLDSLQPGTSRIPLVPCPHAQTIAIAAKHLLVSILDRNPFEPIALLKVDKSSTNLLHAPSLDIAALTGALYTIDEDSTGQGNASDEMVIDQRLQSRPSRVQPALELSVSIFDKSFGSTAHNLVLQIIFVTFSSPGTKHHYGCILCDDLFVATLSPALDVSSSIELTSKRRIKFHTLFVEDSRSLPVESEPYREFAVQSGGQFHLIPSSGVRFKFILLW